MGVGKLEIFRHAGDDYRRFGQSQIHSETFSWAATEREVTVLSRHWLATFFVEPLWPKVIGSLPEFWFEMHNIRANQDGSARVYAIATQIVSLYCLTGKLVYRRI